MKHAEIYGELQVNKINRPDDIHVVPADDHFEHGCDVNCPCNPVQDLENKRDQQIDATVKSLFIHNQIKGNQKELS